MSKSQPGDTNVSTAQSPRSIWWWCLALTKPACKTMRLASSTDVVGLFFALVCLLQIVGLESEMKSFSLDYTDNVLNR